MSTLRNRVLGAIAGVVAAFALIYSFSTPPQSPVELHAAIAASPSGALAVANTAVNGTIGGLTAAQSVDNYSSFVLTQTTTGITATLPTPTNTTPGRQAVISSLVSNTATLTMYGVQVPPGSTYVFQWDGTEWSTSQQGTSTSSTPRPFSYVQMAASLSDAGTPISTFATSAASYTVGMEFYTTVAGHACDGAEIWWIESDAGTDTVQLELWDSLGSATHLATTTVAAGNGYASGTWSPVTLVPGKLYLVSYYVTSNSFTPFWGATPSQASGGGQFPNPSSNNQRGNSGNQVGGIPIGYDMWMTATGNATSGHAKPTSLNTLGGSPVSPIAPLFSQ